MNLKTLLLTVELNKRRHLKSDKRRENKNFVLLFIVLFII